MPFPYKESYVFSLRMRIYGEIRQLDLDNGILSNANHKKTSKIVQYALIWQNIMHSKPPLWH